MDTHLGFYAWIFLRYTEREDMSLTGGEPLEDHPGGTEDTTPVWGREVGGRFGRSCLGFEGQHILESPYPKQS